MASKEPIILAGQPVGRFKAGWLLFKETWRFTMLDKEMLWIPVIAAIVNFFFFGILISALVFYYLTSGGSDIPENSPMWYGFMFYLYAAGAFTLAFSQAAITNSVYTRAHGGDATLGQSLKRAYTHWFSLFIWAVITSTVGLILRLVAERSQLLGKVVASALGMGWSVLTYFVVPAMVIDNHSAFESIGKSGQVFKKTWGETIVSNISYGLVFILINLLVICSLFGLTVFFFVAEVPVLGVLAIIAIFVWVIAASLVASVMEGVIKTILYIYADEGKIPENFNHELVEKMLARKDNSLEQSSPLPLFNTTV